MSWTTAYRVALHLLTTGEALAKELVVSPAAAMWAPNALLLAAALLALGWRRTPAGPARAVVVSG